jgi:ankyrin repeat protein
LIAVIAKPAVFQRSVMIAVCSMVALDYYMSIDNHFVVYICYAVLWHAGRAPSALHIAAVNFHYDAVSVLLDAGAQLRDAPYPDECAATVLQLAVESDEAKSSRMLRLLLLPARKLQRYTDFHLNGQQEGGCSYFLHAVNAGRLQNAKVLIEAGADVHAVCGRGCCALHYAATSGNLALTQFVVSLGVNVNSRCNKGWSPLQHACYSDSTLPAAAIVEYLLSVPAVRKEINAHSPNGDTALAGALREGACEAIVAALLKHGACPDLVGYGGATPLMLAKTVRHACLLLKAGADPTIGKTGVTAADCAAARGNATMAALLQRAADDYAKTHCSSSSSNGKSSNGKNSSSYSSNGSSCGKSSNSSNGSSTTTAAAADTTCGSAKSVKKTAATKVRGVTAPANNSTTAAAAAFTAIAEVAGSVNTACSINTSCGNQAAHQQQQQQQQQQQRGKKTKQPCINCGTLTGKRCTRCKVVYYCSIECQKQMFKDPEHRAECEAKAPVC